MIRQDYMLRMIRDLAQLLARAVSLRDRSEHHQALQEVDQALEKFRGKDLADSPDVEEWIGMCVVNEGSNHEQLESMAEVWRLRAELLAIEHRALAAYQSYTVALGLYLERLKSGMVTRQLIDRVGECVAHTNEVPLPGAVLGRLMEYYEARGWLGQAEDVLFEWVKSGDPVATRAGTTFYERLRNCSDAQLQQGSLTRDEVLQGEADLRIISGPKRQ